MWIMEQAKVCDVDYKYKSNKSTRSTSNTSVCEREEDGEVSHVEKLEGK